MEKVDEYQRMSDEQEDVNVQFSSIAGSTTTLKGSRMFWTWVQLIVDVVTAAAFLFYGIVVEKDEKCYSNGTGYPRLIPLEGDTDVSHVF